MKIIRTALAVVVCAATFGAGATTEANTNQLNALTYNALTYNGIAINASRYHPFTGMDATLSVGAIDDKRGVLRPYVNPDAPLLVGPLTVIMKEGARMESPEMPGPSEGAWMQPQLVEVQLGAAALD